MARTVAIGIQDFDSLISGNYFYVDKTPFIKEWWESGDSVTLITRPRRFGKTLNMSMLDYFFSVEHKERGDLFEGLSIWQDEKYRELQGTYPVINLSFANVKESDYVFTKYRICTLIAELYNEHWYLLESNVLKDNEKKDFIGITEQKGDMSEVVASSAIHNLSKYMYRYFGRKVIILLDEYDTPMQEAYVNGFWDELVSFIRSIFNSAFKTNPYLERAIMTGITRVSKESVFSDFNNPKVVTTTSDEYATAFGFTEEEVFAALDECGYSDEKEKVKYWYDGFIFGKQKDIYNPWSIINFVDTGEYKTYWANTSSNSLVGKLIREGNYSIKEKFEKLIRGETIKSPIDEQIVYTQLGGNDSSVWSLLLAGGYLKVISYEREDLLEDWEDAQYELMLTNNEVKRMFITMVRGWFRNSETEYNDFIKALLLDDIDAMNEYMNRVTMRTFSYFDAGKDESDSEPEKFYHGFVLGLMVDLYGKYEITSNRESGFGRYDIMLEPCNKEKDDAIIIEFKVFKKRTENSLSDTVQAALKQIEDKQYKAQLVAKGVPEDRIRSYGFAFEGKKVLIG